MRREFYGHFSIFCLNSPVAIQVNSNLLEHLNGQVSQVNAGCQVLLCCRVFALLSSLLHGGKTQLSKRLGGLLYTWGSRSWQPTCGRENVEKLK